jgi:cbb3-type cytochrome oxidase subunit 1
MITFAILYWLVPKLWNRDLAHPTWATTHFWLATIGIVLYTLSMWAAGLTEGLEWRAYDAAGQLKYPNFVDIVHQLQPFYWLRLVGGTMYLAGVIMMAWNLFKTMRGPARATAPGAVPVAG